MNRRGLLMKDVVNVGKAAGGSDGYGKGCW